MVKKCIVCEKEAEFCIKGSNECYCKECAEEHFGDLGLLKKIGEAEEEAKKIKDIVEDNSDKEEE